MHPKKQISGLLVLLLLALDFCFGLKVSTADNNKTFPNCQIKEISNFETYCQEIFQIVATKMGLEINAGIQRPIILKDNQINLLKFNRYLGLDCNEIIPYYFHKNNTIVIPRYCKLDSLAHEFVHYFQAMYRNEDFDSTCGMSEVCEFEAIFIQRWFRSKYLDPPKLNHGITAKLSD